MNYDYGYEPSILQQGTVGIGGLKIVIIKMLIENVILISEK